MTARTAGTNSGDVVVQGRRLAPEAVVHVPLQVLADELRVHVRTLCAAAYDGPSPQTEVIFRQITVSRTQSRQGHRPPLTRVGIDRKAATTAAGSRPYR